MANVQIHMLLLAIIAFGLVFSIPQPGGGHGGEHTHFIIHVPELIHKHHHTHVKKIYIPEKSEDSDHDHEHYDEGW